MNNPIKKTINGIKWTALKTIVISATFPFLQIFQARFFSPEEFAYIAVILIFMGLLEKLDNFGITQAIIYSDSIDIEETSSLFFFTVFLGTMMIGLIFLLSNPMAIFFSLPRLSEYLKILGIIIIFQSPTKIFRAILQKHLYFKTLSIMEIIRHFVMIFFFISFVYKGLGVLGFIYANLIASFLSSFQIIFYCLNKRFIKITFFFSIMKALPFLRFGSYVSAKEIMTYFTHRMDEIFIGFFFTPETLGIYSFGKRSLQKIRILVTSSFARVLLPLFSEIKNDKKKLSIIYLKITGCAALVSFPVFFGIAITAHLFVPLFFGEIWTESIPIFQVFSIVMICIVLTASIATSLLYSLNKPNVVFYVDIVTMIIYFSLLCLFAKQGVEYLLIVYPFYIATKFIVIQFFANKELNHSFSVYFRQVLGVLVITLIMGASVKCFQIMTIDVLSMTYQLLGSVFIGVIVFSIFSIVIEKEMVYEIKAYFTKRGY